MAGACQPCPTYQACSGNSLVTQDLVQRRRPAGRCVSGKLPVLPVRIDRHAERLRGSGRVGACGFAVFELPVRSAPGGGIVSGVPDVSGVLRQQPGHAGLVQRRFNPPANASTQSYRQCNAGTTVTATACVSAGGSAPTDTPCPTPPTCAGGASPTWVAGAWECPGCVQPAKPSCSAGQDWTWSQAACAWNDILVSEPSVSGCDYTSWNSRFVFV